MTRLALMLAAIAAAAVIVTGLRAMHGTHTQMRGDDPWGWADYDAGAIA